MLSILSNINCDTIIRRVGKNVQCVDAEGYGSVLEALLNPNSQVNTQKADIVILLIDLREMIGFINNYEDVINDFFNGLQSVAGHGRKLFISDAYYYNGAETDYTGDSLSRKSELFWNNRLADFCHENRNCYVFPLRRLIDELGVNDFYSDKLWYLGSTRYTLDAVKSISREIVHIDQVYNGSIKKALILDLDNTLWGGVAGEDGIDGIKLSDSGIGKAYKEFQSVLLQLKQSGVILAIVSKNNEADAWEIISTHPHMLLSKDDFSAYRINWNSKSVNIQELAKELNIGLDSMVFIDDNPQERNEVREFVPQVAVPDFPEMPEDLLKFSLSIVEKYFKKIEITSEDKQKTDQYIARRKIEEAKNSAVDFSSFLKSLQIRAERKPTSDYMERTAQIVQKTNQFNTTVKRYTASELEEMQNSDKWELFLYEISDKFANHGLCVFAAVDLHGDIPVIDNFLMSCRVMGRNLEFGILADIQTALKNKGYAQVKAIFRKGPKNAPVEHLFDMAGYEVTEENESKTERIYTKSIDSCSPTEFYGTIIS